MSDEPKLTLRIDTQEAIRQMDRVLPRMQETLVTALAENVHDDRDMYGVIGRALGAAFVEGVHYAFVEIVAQGVEGGWDPQAFASRITGADEFIRDPTGEL